MANLKEIRNRIASVSSTMQITSAMKMVSAAKLKRAQDAITKMRPYVEKLTVLLQDLSASIENGSEEGGFSEQREVKKVLLVAITSNRGLCGGFNSSIVKEIRNQAAGKYAGKEVALVCIGKKGNDLLSKEFNVIENRSDVFENLHFETLAEVAQKLMDLFLEGAYDHIAIVYNKFKNTATQLVVSEQFLPIIPASKDAAVQTNIDYIFEPSRQEIVAQLIPKSLKMQLFKAVRDSFASEHGARMTSMHKATDNANELKNELLLTYNKARQAAITNEILEIVGGAEALNG